MAPTEITERPMFQMTHQSRAVVLERADLWLLASEDVRKVVASVAMRVLQIASTGPKDVLTEEYREDALAKIAKMMGAILRNRPIPAPLREAIRRFGSDQVALVLSMAIWEKAKARASEMIDRGKTVPENAKLAFGPLVAERARLHLPLIHYENDEGFFAVAPSVIRALAIAYQGVLNRWPKSRARGKFDPSGVEIEARLGSLPFYFIISVPGARRGETLQYVYHVHRLGDGHYGRWVSRETGSEVGSSKVEKDISLANPRWPVQHISNEAVTLASEAIKTTIAIDQADWQAPDSND